MFKTILFVKNLSKKFGDRYAVSNVSFDIFEGEIFGLIGPNGAGKTTIIKMISGLSKPTSGEIKICGYDISKNFEKAIKNIGGIIENPELYGYMSGRENLKYFASLYGKKKTDVESVIKLVKMDNRIDDKVKTYSLGMKQRLGIAQALLHSPSLLILDEPTNGLDPNGIIEMRKFLLDIAQNKKIAILISSHILSEMEQLCDTIGIINKGKIVQIRTMQQIKQTIADKSRIQFKVDYPNYSAKLLSEKFHKNTEVAANSCIITATEKEVSKIASYLLSEGVAIFGVNLITKTLEELFLEIVNKNNDTRIS